MQTYSFVQNVRLWQKVADIPDYFGIRRLNVLMTGNKHYVEAFFDFVVIRINGFSQSSTTTVALYCVPYFLGYGKTDTSNPLPVVFHKNNCVFCLLRPTRAIEPCKVVIALKFTVRPHSTPLFEYKNKTLLIGQWSHTNATQAQHPCVTHKRTIMSAQTRGNIHLSRECCLWSYEHRIRCNNYAVSFFLPFCLLLLRTSLPFFVLIRFLKPCSILLCLFLGW